MDGTKYKNILSEVTQTQKDKYSMYYKWLLDIKQKIISLESQSQRTLGDTYMDLLGKEKKAKSPESIYSP